MATLEGVDGVPELRRVAAALEDRDSMPEWRRKSAAEKACSGST